MRWRMVGGSTTNSREESFTPIGLKTNWELFRRRIRCWLMVKKEQDLYLYVPDDRTMKSDIAIHLRPNVSGETFAFQLTFIAE
jgi:hypothetical protein